jgi:hypothetical protein
MDTRSWVILIVVTIIVLTGILTWRIEAAERNNKYHKFIKGLKKDDKGDTIS